MSKARVAFTPDRRSKCRYQLKLGMRFRVCRDRHMSRWLRGAISDISSGGASFRCSKPCPVGSYVEMVIDWPIKREDGQLMAMEATGVVVRHERGRIGIRFTSAELRLERADPAALGATV